MFSSAVGLHGHALYSFTSPLLLLPDSSPLLPADSSTSTSTPDFEQLPAVAEDSFSASHSDTLPPLPFLSLAASAATDKAGLHLAYSPPSPPPPTVVPPSPLDQPATEATEEADTCTQQLVHPTSSADRPSEVQRVDSVAVSTSEPALTVSLVPSSIPVDSASAAVVAAGSRTSLRVKRRCSRRPQRRQVVGKGHKASDGNVTDSSLSDNEEQKKHRAAVLDTSVSTAQQMCNVLATLTAACYQQRDSIQQLSRQLKAVTGALHVATLPRRCDECNDLLASLPGDSSSVLSSCLASSALASALLLACRVGICVTDGASGRVLDMNDELLSLCGWRRDDILGDTRPVVGWANVRSQALLRRAVDDELADNNGRMGLTAHQYGRSWQRLWQLYRGELDKIEAVWRCCHAPAETFEMSCSTHVASWQEAADVGDADLCRVPDRVVWIISITDAKRLD